MELIKKIARIVCTSNRKKWDDDGKFMYRNAAVCNGEKKKNNKTWHGRTTNEQYNKVQLINSV